MNNLYAFIYLQQTNDATPQTLSDAINTNDELTFILKLILKMVARVKNNKISRQWAFILTLY